MKIGRMNGLRTLDQDHVDVVTWQETSSGDDEVGLGVAPEVFPRFLRFSKTDGADHDTLVKVDAVELRAGVGKQKPQSDLQQRRILTAMSSKNHERAVPSRTLAWRHSEK
jgi:hypothetical protein